MAVWPWGKSGWELKRGLAYPPNVVPELESWMERVRVTLEKLLDVSVEFPGLINVVLNVSDTGAVTASITPNENTKWIEYAWSTTDYPTLAAIAGGTEVRTAGSPGETHNTATLTTLTAGQTFYFGVVSYSYEEKATPAPSGPPSLPVYVEETFGEGSAGDGDTIVPTVEEQVTRSGTQGTVTLVINDPGSYVNGVSFATYTDQTWNSWVDDYVDPYNLVQSVTMHELHNVGIKWRVRYDIGGGNVFIQNVVMFDVDSNPELSEGYLTVDTTDGDVIYRYVGDDDTLSVLYATAASDWANDAAAKTAAEAGTAIDGRTGPSTGGTVVHSALAEGATRYVAVVPRDAAAGGGNSGSQVYRYQITRPTDTTDDTVPPTVEGDVTYDGSGNATLSLLVNWGSYSVGTVDFKAKVGLGDWDVSWTNDATSPYEHTISLAEKHDSHIKYRVTYGGSLLIQDVVTIDIDTIPELQTAYISVDNAGEAKLVWAGDDDVDYIVWQSASGSDPAYPTFSDPPVLGDGTRDPVAGNARNGEVVIDVGMAEGEDVVASFHCFNAASGAYSLIRYDVRNAYREDTHGEHIPIVTPQFDETQVTLVLDDPDLRISSVAFRNYENGSWGSWSTDSVGPPWDVVRTVTLSEKHNSYIAWKVGYDSDASFIWGAATWDSDTIPEWNNVDTSVDAAGDVWLNWLGDDDVKYLRYKTSLSAYPTWGADPDIEGTRDPTAPTEARAGTVKVYTGLAEGATCYVSYYGFSSDGNTWTPEVGKSRVTRPTDSTSTRAPSVEVTAGTNDVTLAIADPDDVVNAVGFRTYEGGTWSAWVDDTTDPYTLTESVTLEDKHAVAIDWRVRYDLGEGAGNEYVSNRIVFDIDEEPEIRNLNLSVDDSGNVYLAYTGDDDVASIKWYDGTSYPSKATIETSGTVHDFTAAENVLVQSGIAEGTSRFVGVVAYTGDNGTGTASIVAYYARVTRPTDTAGTADITINAKRTVELNGDVKMRWFGTGGVESVGYISNKTGFTAAADDASHADWNTASWQNTATNYRGNVLSSVETLAFGETAYIAMLGYDAVGGGPGSGAHGDAIFKTEITRGPAYKGDFGPASIIYQAADPGTSGFTDGDIWYETDQTPWVKRVFDTGAWDRAASTFPRIRSYTKAGTPTQLGTAWPDLSFKTNIEVDGTEQGVKWGVSEASSDARVTAVIYTLIESASDLDKTGRASGEYIKWDGSGYAFDTPSGTDPALLSDIGDVSTGYASGDLLYYAGSAWTHGTPVELDIVTDTSISVQETDAHKGYLGNDNDLNFEAGAGLTVGVTVATGKATVTYTADASGGSSYGENDGDYSIGIDANGGGTNYFRIKTGTAAGGTTVLTVSEAGKIDANGDIQTDGDFLGGRAATGSNFSIHTATTDYVTLDADNSGRDIQLEATGTPVNGNNNFNLFDGTNRSNITPLHGYATGTGAPTGAAVTGAIYLRY